eukprot:CAMPEP_0204823148 /NCGR_PEP_ID=MMETSP1346-20131115/1260_1 /ASSEMBLY_ACC=CAM_ASM_000771 /TAXON_ID=215587 /ORGANISM="Aplanochytrium stocchinoi, Strain GSBS06" /LENGTH=429 /DNA_ID=CAMNT_0051949689 /DNA_START=258 /DNA_END=1544 /DNA_ORIENTATION=+
MALFLQELQSTDKSPLKHVDEIKVTTITGKIMLESKREDGEYEARGEHDIDPREERLPEWDTDMDGVARLVLVSSTEAHGSLGNKNWKRPVLVADAKGMSARPGYDTLRADEFEDDPEVLDEKIKLLASLISRSKHCVAYTGAGISTSAGVSDYATKASRSKAGLNSETKKTNRLKPWEMLKAQPTYAHRSLATLHDEGFLKGWIQQNHDGLPQKAGMPQYDMNEIHGAWQDPSNPVVAMSGRLRGDLCSDLEMHCDKTDLCLTLGTSLAGMSADRIAILTGKRAQKKVKNVIGTVIVSLQRTPHDNLSCLRMYAKLDDVFEKLMKLLRLNPHPELASNQWAGRYYNLPADMTENQLVFTVPYTKDGARMKNGAKSKTLMVLDMRPGTMLRITDGPNKNDQAKIIRRDEEGNWEVELQRNAIRHKYGVW